MSELVFDSDEWREERNANLRKWIGDDWAVNWFLQFCDIAELFDDIVDQDKEISEERAVRALYACVVDMPSNPFFAQHAPRLVPIFSTWITSWVVANKLEKNPTEKNLHISFILRNLYTMTLNSVIEITRGRQAMLDTSMEILEFFGHESFQDYSSEFSQED